MQLQFHLKYRIVQQMSEKSQSIIKNNQDLFEKHIHVCSLVKILNGVIYISIQDNIPLQANQHTNRQVENNLPPFL